MVDSGGHQGTLWRIGALARAVGLSVRTLHYYEQLGLVSPVQRTDGGHRLYDDDAIVRLYRVRALKALGLPLSDIARAVADAGDLRALLVEHLAHVEHELERLHALHRRLQALTAADAAAITGHDLLETVASLSRVEQHASSRRERLAPDDAEREWRELGAAVRRCIARGLDPASPDAAKAARSARQLIDRFTGGDRQLDADLARLRHAGFPAGLAGWDAATAAYLDRALAHLHDHERS